MRALRLAAEQREFAAATVVWDDQGLASPGDPITMHGYRGGPFGGRRTRAAGTRPEVVAAKDRAAPRRG